MAIAPSKPGRLVAQHWHSDVGLVQQLRESRLVREDASDEDLRATFKMARDEVLTPFLSDRGSRWAVPLDSLNLPDDDAQPSQSGNRSPWWKFWG
jgi:hypothetical protein